MTATRLTSFLGSLLSRFIVPAWLLTGAIFKLYFRDPQSLPESIWSLAHEMNVDLDVLLRSIVGIEFIVAGVMFFSARLARPVAIALTSLFCLILLNEMRIGAASCGCLGKVVMPPEIMLLIDLPMLIGVLALSTRRKPSPAEPDAKWRVLKPWTAVLAVLWLAASVGTVFGVPNKEIAPPPTPPAPPVVNDGGDDKQTVPDPVADGCLPQLKTPPSYIVLEPEEWVGKRWAELEIAHYVTKHPKDICTGRRYVVLYSPSCDHCYDMLYVHFADPLPAPTTVIAIPEYKDRWETSGVYPMPCEECERSDLQFGCNYMVTPPVIVALEDGVVICAALVEDPLEVQCLQWH